MADGFAPLKPHLWSFVRLVGQRWWAMTSALLELPRFVGFPLGPPFLYVALGLLFVLVGTAFAYARDEQRAALLLTVDLIGEPNLYLEADSTSVVVGVGCRITNRSADNNVNAEVTLECRKEPIGSFIPRAGVLHVESGELVFSPNPIHLDPQSTRDAYFGFVVGTVTFEDASSAEFGRCSLRIYDRVSGYTDKIDMRSLLDAAR